MTVLSRLNYYRRIAAAYLTPLESQLDFWYEPPEVNPRALCDTLGEYYMPFTRKADYQGVYDEQRVPMLNYRGAIGVQYNPIAIAQYGLGNYNLFQRTGDPLREEKFLRAANWLLWNRERNAAGLSVWNHHFDWEYRTPLKAPWYSGLAQGQGISLLVRAHQATGDGRYLSAAADAFESFLATTDHGGVTYVDNSGNIWVEEYITSPPTHILNGLIWASWGVYDFYLATSSLAAKGLFSKVMDTLSGNLQNYDTGFWSLYEQSGTRMKMLASQFYHSLHVTQLSILHRLTGREIFRRFADKWQTYLLDRRNCLRATVHKSIFKLGYY
jgi:heparosan-N-sulfate-glucuronate 5-epimerase